MTAPGPPPGAGGLPPVGTLATEAAQLLDALAVRLAQVRLTVADRAPGSAPAGGDPGEPDPDRPDSSAGHQQCVGWCPVCRSADLLRGERPEVAGKLVDSAITVVGALRSLLPTGESTGESTGASSGESTGESTGGDLPSGPGAGGSAAGPGGASARPPGIERIDIR